MTKGLRGKAHGGPPHWSDAPRELGFRRLLEARPDPARTQQVAPQERGGMLALTRHRRSRWLHARCMTRAIRSNTEDGDVAEKKRLKRFWLMTACPGSGCASSPR